MKATDILSNFSPEHENILSMLHALQDNNPYNYLSNDDLRAVADYLNTTMSHVYGVASYYSMLSTAPRGRHIIRVCKSPVCSMAGSRNIIDMIRTLLDIGPGDTTGDKIFTLEYTECLGQCDIAPVMMIDRELYSALNEDSLREVLEKYKNKDSG